MISFHSQLKVCGNRILKSNINVITAAKRYNLRPGTWCSRMCLRPTLYVCRTLRNRTLCPPLPLSGYILSPLNESHSRLVLTLTPTRRRGTWPIPIVRELALLPFIPFESTRCCTSTWNRIEIGSFWGCPVLLSRNFFRDYYQIFTAILLVIAKYRLS